MNLNNEAIADSYKSLKNIYYDRKQYNKYIIINKFIYDIYS